MCAHVEAHIPKDEFVYAIQPRTLHTTVNKTSSNQT